MKSVAKTALLTCAAVTFAAALPTTIQNVQFTDTEGNSYDLFNLLDRGTRVYVELVDNI